MPMSKNPHAYADVKVILDQAENRTKTTYTLPTEGKARHWTQRAYSFRKVLYNQALDQVGHVPGYAPASPYSTLVLRLDGCAVHITHRQIEGVLSGDEGEPVPQVVVEEDDVLLATAREFAKELNLDFEDTQGEEPSK